MNWQIIYFSERVRSDVSALPPGIRADYLRLAELIEEHRADLRLTPKQWRVVCLNCVPKAQRGLVVCSTPLRSGN